MNFSKMKITALLLSLTVLMSLSACAASENKPLPQSSSVSSSSASKEQSGKLKNHMTDKEKSSITVGKFSLLDSRSGDDSPEAYLKKTWEFNADEVSKIIDSIKEISVYDEELDTTFIVHVTLPPNFDKSKTYPMLVMTDGVWRFNDQPMLRKMMEKNETEDVILASIGYDFSIDGTDNFVRKKYFCDNRQKFLNFITDNLMPYLDGEYNIDYQNTTLFGHSLGGVFTHFAAFNSDLFENQPFHNYIIGSPAFWSPCFINEGEYKTEYGYFDRNKKLDKTLYIAGGADEDPDYEQYYGENDSTLEGITHLCDRLKKYGVTSFESKIYANSNHYQYIPEMFRVYFLKYYKK